MTENVEYHFSTGRYTRGGHFYYEDPGDASNPICRRLTGMTKVSPITYTESESRTGVAYELYGFNNGGNFTLNMSDITLSRKWGYSLGYSAVEWMKDVWIKFDVCGHAGGTLTLLFYYINIATYMFDGSPTYVSDHWEDVTLKFGDSQSGDAIIINNDANSGGADGNKKISYTTSLQGLHSVKVHLVSDPTNGVFDVFLDNDTVPIHTFRGKVAAGLFYDSFSFNTRDSIDHNAPIYVSNIVVSSTEPSLSYIVPYNEVEHPVVTHASVGYKIENPNYVWRYDNVGTFDENVMSTDGLEFIEVHDNNYSNVGVGLAFEYNWMADEYGYSPSFRLAIPNDTEFKEYWIECDVYGFWGDKSDAKIYTDPETNETHTLYGEEYSDTPCFRCTCYHNEDYQVDTLLKFSNEALQDDDNEFIMIDNERSWWDDNEREMKSEGETIYERKKIPLYGFHSIKIHVKASETDGIYELYIDDKDTPFHKYTGNVANGVGLTNHEIYFYLFGVVLSNIKISNKDTNIDYVWRATCNGTVKEFGDRMIELHDNDVSRIGVAVAIKDSESIGDGFDWNWKNDIKVKKPTEAWVKFDACTIDSYAYLWYGMDENNGYCKIDWKSDDTVDITIDRHSDSISDTFTLTRDEIHTFRVHVTQIGRKQTHEFYFDNENTPRYNYTVETEDGDYSFTGIQFQSSGVAVSNFIASNMKIDANETLPQYNSPPFYYENPGKIDNVGIYEQSDIIEVRDSSVSRTGCGIYNDPAMDEGNGRTGISTYCKVSNEMWAMMDIYYPSDDKGESVIFVFSYNGVYGDNQETGVYLSTKYACIYVANDEQELKTDAEVNKENPFASPVGLHTVKMHVISHKTHGLFELFIDNESTPYYTYSGNVANGKLFTNNDMCCLEIYSAQPIMSNIILSSSDIPMRRVATAPRFYYENPGIDDGKMSSNLGVQEIEDDTVSRTGRAIKAIDTYSLEYPVFAWDNTLNKMVSLIDRSSNELWIKFDAYFYDYDAFDDDGVISDDSYDNTGIWCGCCGDGTGVDVIMGWTSPTSVTISFRKTSYSYDNPVQQETCDMSRGLHSFKMHYILEDNETLVELYIDNDETAICSYHSDQATPKPSNMIWATYNSVISNIAIGASDMSMDYIVKQGDGITHADIYRSLIDANRYVWHYKNIGVATDFSEGRRLKDVSDNTLSHTGVGVTYDENKSAYDTPYITIPSEVSCELWVKFDVYCPTNDGFVYTEYGTGRQGVLYNKDLPHFSCHYVYGDDCRTGMLVYCSEYQFLDDAYYNEYINVNQNGQNNKSKTMRLPFNGFHTVRYHIISGASDGIFEIYVDDETTPYYRYVGNVCDGNDLGGGKVELALSETTASNIIVSTNYIGMNKMANGIDFEVHADVSRAVKKVSQGGDTPQPEPETYETTAHADISRTVIGQKELPKEGVATRQPIDLGSELTVGIGIVLDGEGYAMIRTAGEDGRYTEWESYVPCERTCRFIDIQLHVLGTITSAILTIDKRTVSKTISKHLTAGENVVDYEEAFYNIPAVIPTAIGDGVVAHVISKDKTSCVIKITDGNNNAVEGDVDILIRGW